MRRARRTRIAPLAALLGALALVAAACGGGGSGSAGGSGASGAEVVPASVPVYVSVDSDLSSDQWQQAQKLLDRFPGRDKLLGDLRRSFESDSNGVTWEDVKVALGPEVDVAVLDLQGSNVVGLTQPKDAAKWDELVRKGNASGSDRLYSRDYKGWKIFSDTQAKLDRFVQEADQGSPLADDATYGEATAKLPDQALVKAYANGARLTAQAKQALEGLNAAMQGPGELDWLAADAVAAADGVKLDVYSKGATATSAKPYAAKLLDVVPSGALLYASFSGKAFSSEQFRNAFENGLNGSGAGLPQAQQLLQVFEQLGPLLENENALYVRPAPLIPEVTLVAQPSSPERGLAAVDRLVQELTAVTGGRLQTRPVTIGSVKATELNLGRFSLFYGALEGRVVVSDTQQAFGDLGGGGTRLADDETFKDAMDAAGMPAETNGFLYVNLKDAIPAFSGLAQLGGVSMSSEVRDNLRPLRALVAWARADGQEGGGSVFLEIK